MAGKEAPTILGTCNHPQGVNSRLNLLAWQTSRTTIVSATIMLNSNMLRVRVRDRHLLGPTQEQTDTDPPHAHTMILSFSWTQAPVVKDTIWTL